MAADVRRFSWTGRSDGRDVAGVSEAPDAPSCAALLAGRGIVALTVHPLAAGADAPGVAETLARWRGPRRVAPLDRQLFARQMHTLLRSGVPILRALAGLRETTPSAALRAAIDELSARLAAGHELSSAMAQQPHAFDAFTVSMVRVGETTGRLDEVFLRLAQHEEFDAEMRQQVKSALRYPMFVVAAMAVAVVVINVMVLPAFAKVFAGFDAPLPWATRALLESSAFTLRWGWAIAIAAVGAALALRRWIATPHGRLRWDRQALAWPVAGAIVRQATLARFARSLAMALKSGVPIEQALAVVGQTADNAWITRRIDAMRETIGRGESLTRAAAASGEFTPVVLQMLGVGEETGALDELLDEVAKLHAAEVEHSLRTLAQSIEPLLIVAIGVMVLVLALGVFLPLWDLGQIAFKK